MTIVLFWSVLFRIICVKHGFVLFWLSFIKNKNFSVLDRSFRSVLFYFVPFNQSILHGHLVCSLLVRVQWLSQQTSVVHGQAFVLSSSECDGCLNRQTQFMDSGWSSPCLSTMIAQTDKHVDSFSLYQSTMVALTGKHCT